MGWLDRIDIGRDLQMCPDCDREYEVLKQFLGEEKENQHELIDMVFNDTYYIELRCPQCLETRYLSIKSLTPNQFYNEKEKVERK